ncbi:hypothetical protein ABEF95_009632 [Exophiala dermatitidis]
MYYAREFDVIGLLLISAGMALFLLSFSLYSYQRATWQSALIICFIVIGGLLIIAFAPIYLAWYIWDSYFYSLLIVVFRQTVMPATYIGNIYTIGSTFWALVVRVCIRINGRLK